MAEKGPAPASAIESITGEIHKGLIEHPDENLERIFEGFLSWGSVIDSSKRLTEMVKALAKENAELKRELKWLKREKSEWMKTAGLGRAPKRAKVELVKGDGEEQDGEEVAVGEKSEFTN